MADKFQTGKVVTISFGHLINDTYSAFFAPMLPLLIAKLGLSLSLVGLLDVVRKIPSLFNPFIGLLADKMCVKYIVIWTPGFTALFMSLVGLSPSYLILFILLFVSGISSTLFHVPAPVMIKHLSAEKTGAGMSYFMFGGELARTLGPLIITAAMSLWGLEGSFRTMPVGVLASAILYFKLKDIQPISRNNKNNKTNAGATIRRLVPFFIAISAYQFFRAAMKSALTLYLPTYLASRGESLWVAGISLSIIQFAGAGGVFLTGFIADKISHRTMLLILAVTSPFLMFAFVTANKVLMIPLLILLGFVVFASGPVILALVQDTNTERPAFVNGIYMTLQLYIEFGHGVSRRYFG